MYYLNIILSTYFEYLHNNMYQPKLWIIIIHVKDHYNLINTIIYIIFNCFVLIL